MTWKVLLRSAVIVVCLLASYHSWNLIAESGREKNKHNPRSSTATDPYPTYDETSNSDAYEADARMHMLATAQETLDLELDMSHFQEDCRAIYRTELRGELELQYSIVLSTHAFSLVSERKSPQNDARRVRAKTALDQHLVLMMTIDPTEEYVRVFCQDMHEVLIDMQVPYDFGY